MDALEIARRHVEEGRAVIERQRALISEMKVWKLNTEQAESLLDAFERTQQIFEDDLARLEGK